MAKSRVDVLFFSITSLLISAAIAWRQDGAHWMSAAKFVVTTGIGFLVQYLASRRFAWAHFTVQAYRNQVSSGAVALLVLAAFGAWGMASEVQALLGAGRWWDAARMLVDTKALLGSAPASLCAVGAVFGIGIAQLLPRAMSTSLTDSGARRPQATLCLLLALAILAVPEWGASVRLALFTLGVAAGVAGTWGFHWFDVRTAENRRRLSLLGRVETDRQGSKLWDAVRLFMRGRLAAALRLARKDPDVTAQLLCALCEYFLRKYDAAGGRLENLLKQHPRLAGARPEELTKDEAEVAAKIAGLRARVYHAIGKETEVREQLDLASRCDPNCFMVMVARQTMLDRVTLGDVPFTDVRDDSLLDLLRITSENGARIRTVNAALLTRAYDVNTAFFLDAIALELWRRGHGRNAATVIALAVARSPEYALARLHQGMFFMHRAAQVAVSPEEHEERAEYSAVARIAFLLAIQFSPENSVTANKAREQLEKLPSALPPGTARSDP